MLKVLIEFSGGDVLSDVKKGHVKFTLEMEINEALMEILKESIKNMPEMMKMWQSMRMQRKSEEKTWEEPEPSFLCARFPFSTFCVFRFSVS